MMFPKVKKILLATLAGLTGSLVSCVDETYLPESVNMEKDFVLTVDVPEGFRSRADQYFGDGALNELHLQYAIFGYDGAMVYSSDDSGSPKATSVDNGRWQLKLRLAEGMDYKAFFWADQFGIGDANPYTVDLKKAHLSVDYEKAFTPENLESDRCDAYAVYKEFTAGHGLSFTLKRPFCQVNVGSPEPSVVESGSAYHDKHVTMSWDSNTLVTGLSFVDGSTETSSLPAEADPDAYPDRWPGMKISDFDYADFKFIDSEDSKYMYMAYLLVSGKEKKLNLHIEGTDENFVYHPEVTGKVAQNSRLIVVPKWEDGGDGFIDPRERTLTFIIKYDPGFGGDKDNIISEEVKVDVLHTLTWTLGNGVESVTIDGKVYTENGSVDILEGTKVLWEVTPEDGYAVDGAESGFVTMNGNQTLDFTATWIDVYYTLSWTINSNIASITINGTRYTTSGSMQFIEGSKITWSSTAASGYIVDDESEGTFFMSADKELSPTASPIPANQYTFSWTIDAGISHITVNGTNYSQSSYITVEEGTRVVWEAVAKPGYTVNGSSSGSQYMYDNVTCNITSSPITVEPDPEYTFSWSGDDGVQSVTVNGITYYGASGSITVVQGSAVVWSATAKSGYNIVSGGSGAITVFMNRNVNIVTEPIEPDPGPDPDPTYTFSWSGDEGVASVTVNGSSYGASGSITVKKGDSVSWSASAKTGYRIVSGGSGSVTMTGNHHVDIETEPIEPEPDPTYTFSWSGDNGVQSVTVNGATYYDPSGSITVKKGDRVSWSATAKTGYNIVSGGSGSVTITGNHHVDIQTAPEPDPTYTFSWSGDGGVQSVTVNGSSVSISNSITVKKGDVVSWSATAKTGYRIVSGGSGSVTINADYHVDITTEKEPDPEYTFSWSIDEGVASITVNGSTYTSDGSITVKKGDSVSWSASAKSGYNIMSGGSGSLTINGDASTNVRSKKEVKYCTITWSCDEGVASITVNGRRFTASGSIQVEVGSTVSYSATTKSGYQFTSPDHDTFQVMEGAEGGVITIVVTTQRI